jgi:hypothetical protein
LTTKKTGTGKGSAKKLKLKKDTVKDLDPKKTSVKGGAKTKLSFSCMEQFCGTWTCNLKCI